MCLQPRIVFCMRKNAPACTHALVSSVTSSSEAGTTLNAAASTAGTPSPPPATNEQQKEKNNEEELTLGQDSLVLRVVDEGVWKSGGSSATYTPTPQSQRLLASGRPILRLDG